MARGNDRLQRPTGESKLFTVALPLLSLVLTALALVSPPERRPVVLVLLGAVVFVGLALLSRYVVRQLFDGAFYVRSNRTTWEILRTDGSLSLFDKHLDLKVQRDRVSSFNDWVWGDGGDYESFRCKPGEAVDFYDDGKNHHTLISLRRDLSRGQDLKLHIHREYRDGFTKETEYIDFATPERTRLAEVSVIFPRDRHCKTAYWSAPGKRRKSLDASHFTNLEDGRQKLSVVFKPRRWTPYTLEWEW